MYTSLLSVADALKSKYGGNYYVCRRGYVWVVSKTEELLKIYDEVELLLEPTSNMHRIKRLRPFNYNKKPPP